ncbi:MAG: GNAT family N-acetyltransferase [Chitinophagaceae bacterium]|nr:GNAT family N-acetyltransferase [Chitinophagaceae bacterium]MBS4043201.1 GNAT family N-acetyltransferase [Chitinophagaceae bacterium]
MNSNFPNLKTDNLYLRQFEDLDLENVYQGLSDPIIIKYYGVSYASLEATKAQIQYFKDLEANNSGFWWAITAKNNGIFYGAIGLYNIDKKELNAEIGFWLLTDYWGKGIMLEALLTICDYAFDALKLNKIEAFVETENENSKNLLRKLGFQHNGTMKNCELKNDKWISLDIFSKYNLK